MQYRTVLFLSAQAPETSFLRNGTVVPPDALASCNVLHKVLPVTVDRQNRHQRACSLSTVILHLRPAPVCCLSVYCMIRAYFLVALAVQPRMALLIHVAHPTLETHYALENTWTGVVGVSVRKNGRAGPRRCSTTPRVRGFVGLFRWGHLHTVPGGWPWARRRREVCAFTVCMMVRAISVGYERIRYLGLEALRMWNDSQRAHLVPILDSPIMKRCSICGSSECCMMQRSSALGYNIVSGGADKKPQLSIHLVPCTVPYRRSNHSSRPSARPSTSRPRVHNQKPACPAKH